MSWFQLGVAAVASLDAESSNTLKTHTLNSELVFRLAASSNITLSLKTLGINKTSTEILVALFDATDADIQNIRSIISGEEDVHYNPETRANIDKIKIWYNIGNAELAYDEPTKALLKSVVTRISLQQF